jgi:hypothetical protein
VQSFNLKGKNIVSFDLDGDVIIKDWSHDVLRIQMEVSLEKGNPNALKGLATTGRYVLRPSLEEDKVSISAPGLEKRVTYRGAQVEESVRYIIFVPAGILVEGLHEGSTAAVETEM